jgi:hypothetical protein
MCQRTPREACQSATIQSSTEAAHTPAADHTSRLNAAGLTWSYISASIPKTKTTNAAAPNARNDCAA